MRAETITTLNQEKLSGIGELISEALCNIEWEEINGECLDDIAPICLETERVEDCETDSVVEMSCDDLLGFIAENDISDLENMSDDRSGEENENNARALKNGAEKLTGAVSDLTKILGFELLVSKDRLRCYAKIDPMFFECPPKPSSIISALAQSGIRTGIATPETIGKRTTESAHTGSQPFVVALGTPPKKGKNAAVKYQFDFLGKREKDTDARGNLDHHESSKKLISVAAGEILAIVSPAEKGEPGLDVFGNVIPGRNGLGAPISAGRNVSKDAGGLKYFATVSGQVLLSRDELSVVPLLDIDGDLDYSVGNIDFKGSVRIKGNVLDGFRIKAGGDVAIGKNVEGAFIECGGNIAIGGGIVGRGVAQIECSGSIKASFIESASVIAEGNVIVSKGIINSDVMSNANVIVSDGKGKIIGGRIISRNLVESFSIGSQVEVKTEILAGRDAGAQKALWSLSSKKDILNKHLEKINQLEDRSKRAVADGQFIPDKLRFAVRAALDKKRQIIAALETLAREEARRRIELVKDIPGRVKVEGIIYPNTRVEIGLSKMKFDEPARRVLLAEDKNNDKLIQLELV